MAVEGTAIEMIQYRLAIVRPDSRKLLTVEAIGGCRLPIVSIPSQARPAEQLQKAMRYAWNLNVLILDFLPSSPGASRCAVGELLDLESGSDLGEATLEQVIISELSEQQRIQIASLLAGNLKNPFAQIGWIDEAVAWVESATQKTISSKAHIEQYNAGGYFSLVRFHTKDVWHYWMKATGEPNVHEVSVTSLLARLCPGYLPEVVATRPAWNAWLMREEAVRFTEMPNEPSQLFLVLEDAIEAMAELQMKTAGHSVDLLNAGAFDQSMTAFQKHSDSLFDYLEETMSLQTSTKVPRLEKARLREIRIIVEDVCGRVEELDLPEAILHGDLNSGNILRGDGHCQFIDWSEAYVGNPFISLQHLLLLNKAENPDIRASMNGVLKDRYRSAWLKRCDPLAIDTGFIYMPVLAIVSTLYGRADWLTNPLRDDVRCQASVRSLTRHLDRAASDPALLKELQTRTSLRSVAY